MERTSSDLARGEGEAGPAPDMDKLNLFLQARPNAPKDTLAVFTKMLKAFVDANEDPMKSPHYQSKGGDDLSYVIKVAKHPAVDSDETLILLLLKVFKILSRKQDNRESIGEIGIRSVLRFLRNPVSNRVAAEGANVVLNLCYEKRNVSYVLQAGGVAPMVASLQTPDEELQANAAGAIQSISFQEEGRAKVRDSNAIPPLVKLLSTNNLKVKTRAVGALHNMSSDAETIRIIRRHDGIPPLIALLSDGCDAVCGSAAGALQNVSREVASRALIRDGGAVPPLSLLLAGMDVQAQVCAAGALLNILGPELGEEDGGPSANRKGFAKLLSSAIVLGAMYETLFEQSMRNALLA